MELTGVVLITGGTGSLGQAIVRRARRENWNCDIIIFSRDEYKQSLMKSRYPEYRYMLGDVRDADALDLVCRDADYIIHTAAYKQVPSSEANAQEAVKTNVIGSMNVALSAMRAGVVHVVGISTDKACEPINCYGQSKAVMERLFQSYAAYNSTTFSLVRYGNVVGSRGSIVPFFLKQAEKGGPFTITDRRMTRFWLSLEQSVNLIIKAFSEGISGTIIVPKVPSMKVEDVARAINPNIEILDIGIRPGEKIQESLVSSGEALHTEDIGTHYRIYPATFGFLGNLPFDFSYTTDKNNLWLTIEEMSRMIDEYRYESGEF